MTTSAGETWVIVGAGSAGCVVAARLSEDAHRHVVLLEAGPDLAPPATPDAVLGSDFFDALALPGRTHDGLMATRVDGGVPRKYARGRGVGGSSVVNAMVALRGDPAMYRAWGWDDVDDAFARIAIPTEVVADAELGAVDRALLEAAPAAERAVLTRRDGRRVSAAEAMLWPARDRPNLQVRADASVARVVLRGRRATGVELVGGEVVDADRVVVCAGAIHTPAILLRSGVDTPGVGEGLQDHPSAPLTLVLRPGSVAAPTALVVGSLLQQDPLQFLPMNHLGRGSVGLGLLMVALMRPHGRAGTVRVASDDPTIEPVVDFAMLRDPRDLAALVAGVRDAMALVRTDPFERIVDSVVIDDAGTTVDRLTSDGAIETWLRTSAADYVHASSSCAMGTVVDGDGHLVGYAGLSICDASVFPTVPDVNTHLPTTMLAERLTARWRAR